MSATATGPAPMMDLTRYGEVVGTPGLSVIDVSEVETGDVRSLLSESTEDER